jgi:hypothetical protein
MNNLLPRRMGLEMPRPGRLFFQAMLVSESVVGSSGSGETPVPAGPRNWSQSAARVEARGVRRAARERRKGVMVRAE